MRSSLKVFIFAPAIVLAAACSKDKPADATLSNDLTLAAQARQTATLDSISAAERARAAAPVAAPALRTGSTTPARTTTRRRSTSSSGRSTSSSSGTVVASEPRTVTEKNTKRDAAIGAAAGAIIGATTSKDKVKGGIIGAAAGGILGGIIGNNVDIKKKKVP
jgi:YMGG-like Gly-zipper